MILLYKRRSSFSVQYGIFSRSLKAVSATINQNWVGDILGTRAFHRCGLLRIIQKLSPSKGGNYEVYKIGRNAYKLLTITYDTILPVIYLVAMRLFYYSTVYIKIKQMITCVVFARPFPVAGLLKSHLVKNLKNLQILVENFAFENTSVYLNL